MRHFLRFLVCAALWLAAAGASADSSVPVQRVSMSAYGAQAFTLSAPGEHIAQGFAVRVVDAQQKPIPGLTVDFFTDFVMCYPEDPHCPIPAAGTYGHFENVDYQQVVTDANGVAVTAAYVGGTAAGTYHVAALLWHLGSPYNEQVLVGVDAQIAEFTINQVLGAAPAASVPGLGRSASALLALGLLLAGIAARWRLRVRFLPARRSEATT